MATAASSSRRLLRDLLVYSPLGASTTLSAFARTASAPRLSSRRFVSSSSTLQQEGTTLPSAVPADPTYDDLAGSDFDENEPPRNMLPDTQFHKRTHGHHVCTLHMSAYSAGEVLENLQFFADFALRTAYALGIPASQPKSLPRQTSLWTVLKGPFVHKKSQENFMRRVSTRTIKVWDANEDIVDKWLYFLRLHQMHGVAMKAELFKSRPLSIGRTIFEGAQQALREGESHKAGEAVQGDEFATTQTHQSQQETLSAEQIQPPAEESEKQPQQGGST